MKRREKLERLVSELTIEELRFMVESCSERLRNLLPPPLVGSLEGSKGSHTLLNSYISPISPDISPKNALTHTHEATADDVDNASQLDIVPTGGRIGAERNWYFIGERRKDSKGKCDAPSSVVVTDSGYRWAREQDFRGSKRHLQRTADKCLSYFTGNGTKMKDWDATLRNWIWRQIEWKKDLDATDVDNPHALTVIGGNAIPQGNVHTGGQYGQAGRARTGYGYDQHGNPTNKATATKDALQQLAEWKRDQLSSEAGGDADGGERPGWGGD